MNSVKCPIFSKVTLGKNDLHANDLIIGIPTDKVFYPIPSKTFDSW